MGIFDRLGIFHLNLKMRTEKFIAKLVSLFQFLIIFYSLFLTNWLKFFSVSALIIKHLFQFNLNARHSKLEIFFTLWTNYINLWHIYSFIFSILFVWEWHFERIWHGTSYCTIVQACLNSILLSRPSSLYVLMLSLCFHIFVFAWHPDKWQVHYFSIKNKK